MTNYRLNENSSLFLDLLRAITAQVVVIGHGISFFSVFTFLQPPRFPYMQNIAVLIFFILSGFLISYSISNHLERNHHYNFKDFFIDRFSRIYTAYLPAILLVAALDAVHLLVAGQSYIYTDAYTLLTAMGNIAMLQDFPLLITLHKKIPSVETITSFGSARPFWTLAIEWWIYLWVGYFVFKIVKNSTLSWQNILMLLLLSIVPVYNLVGGRGNGLTLYWLMGTLVYWFSGLFLEFKLTAFIQWTLLFLLLLTACLRLSITVKEYEPVLAFLLAAAILVSISITAQTKIFQKYRLIIRFAANYSFTLYLIHYTVLDLICSTYKNTTNPILLFTMGLVLCNILAALLGYYTEMKITPIVKHRLKALITK